MKYIMIVLCLIISLTGCDKVVDRSKDSVNKMVSFSSLISQDTDVDTRIIDDLPSASKRKDRVPSRNNVTGMYNGLYGLIGVKEDKNKLHSKPVLNPVKDTYLYYDGTSYIPKVGSGGGVTIDEVDSEILTKTPPSYGAIKIMSGGMYIEADVPNDTLEFLSDTPDLLAIGGNDEVGNKSITFDVILPTLLAGENITIKKSHPNHTITISSKGGGSEYWYEDKITKDITCDSEVTVGDNLTVKGNILFGNEFLMDTSKVNHTNNIPQFNPDTKQVDFVPLTPSTSRVYQVYDLDQFSLSQAEYKDGWITFGTNPDRDYSNIELKTLMPPNCMSMTVYISYTHRGFGESGGKPYPYIAISADVSSSYHQGNDITVPIYNDIHFPQDTWHQGSKQMTVELQSFNLDRNEAKPITFSITPTGIIKDSKNYWILKGFAVGYTVYN